MLYKWFMVVIDNPCSSKWCCDRWRE